jgi:hypothetical protein
MRLSKHNGALVALLSASLASAVSIPVRAADELPVDYEVGKVLMCDNRAEAERFVVLFNGDAPAAIEIVNAEQLHRNRASLGTAGNRDDAFEIVRILVIGVQSDNAMR